MMHRLLQIIVLAIALLAGPGRAAAQAPEFRLDVQRNFGYGAGSNLRGDMSNRIFGPAETIRSVTYLIDGQEMATVSEPPFSFRYNTDSYPPGWHELVAVVTTIDGREVTTPVVRVNYLSAEQQNVSMRNLFLPLGGGLLLATLIGLGLQFLTARNTRRPEPGEQREYGFSGGTICSRCGRPFALQFFAPNMLAGKLTRCPFCGKVGIMRRRSAQDLAAAEAAELAGARAGETRLPGAGEAMTEEEKMRRMLDDSRYDG
jgi:DNA-directed RNA polymerase subunit RPC12/RpoP